MIKEYTYYEADKVYDIVRKIDKKEYFINSMITSY